eukprot:GFYU01001560.1.p1 GENE.GFYU01001560.1~~GFYU01001560.1.p1  ORF type:complete len:183 (+),score=60.15 GFYU01001560.1:34-549(+)
MFGSLCRSAFRSSAIRRSSTDFNWATVSDTLSSQEARSELTRLRKAAEGIDKQVAAGEVGTIDWAFYKRAVRTPGVVETMEKAYKETMANSPKYQNTVTAQFDGKFNSLIDSAKAAAESSKTRVAELERELAEVEMRAANIAETTVEAELEANPEIAKEIDEEIKNHDWTH